MSDHVYKPIPGTNMTAMDRETHRRVTMGEDPHSGSRRSDVWVELRAQTTEKIPNATRTFAELRIALNTADQHVRHLFESYEKTRAVLEEGGVLAQMKLSPMLDAAHGAWLRDRDVPKRIELSEISEAPIPPEDA
jgi:hypothetical protein